MTGSQLSRHPDHVPFWLMTGSQLSRHPEFISGSQPINFNQPMREFFVYILSSRSKNLYIGVTNNIEERVLEHRNGKSGGFTSKYNINKLVYFEEFKTFDEAVGREKQLKNWHRQWKINLIENENLNWSDLSSDWYREVES